MSVDTAGGYDAVLAIAPESYAITYDAADVAHAPRMDEETRRRLVAAVESAHPEPGSIEQLDVKGGYLRTRMPGVASTDATPKDVLSALREAISSYNRRHATEGLDEFRPGDSYITTCRPEDARTAEEFIEAHTGDERAPDVDGPLLEYTNDAPPNQMPDRNLSYRAVVTFDVGAMYDPEPNEGFSKPPKPFRWGEAAREALRATVEDAQRWPGGGGAIQHVVVHPEYAVVDYHDGALNVDPEKIPTGQAGIQYAFEQFNRIRSNYLEEPDREDPPAKLTTDSPGYIGALAPPTTVDEWIEAKGLDEIDGEPYEPDADAGTDRDAEADGGGLWSKVSSVGGGS